MAATERPGLFQRTPITEWIASGLGLLLTLAVLAYLIVEGVTQRDGAPALTVVTKEVEQTAGGFVVPLALRNRGDATAAAVEIRGTLERGGEVIEERRLSFAYVPGGGEARGGLVFQHDPKVGQLRIAPEGYEEP